uniref:LRAT domain-containing protein n=1 Tax=Vombatus ursinus TaxID=29139 RepID=A0A4X2KD03_VOMUR
YLLPSPVPKPGDLIEIFRRGYSHWAVYVGYGCVVHLVPPREYAGGVSLFANEGVGRELLYVMVGSNRYQVNNKYDDSDPPLPPSQIVHRALKLVGKMVPYNLLNNNCEHFATRLRSGVPRSDQVCSKAPVDQPLPGYLSALILSQCSSSFSLSLSISHPLTLGVL